MIVPIFKFNFDATPYPFSLLNKYKHVSSSKPVFYLCYYITLRFSLFNFYIPFYCLILFQLG